MLKATALALTMTLMALPAHAAQEYILPTLFDVTGVATNDVLNIRENPFASAPIIGSFMPGQTQIEVIEEENGWGRVNSGERSGWVAMRYLVYRQDSWQENALPSGFSCYGTEPFRGLTVRDDQAVLGGRFRDPSRAIIADGLTASIVPQICSDGMSDRLMGLRASVILHGEAPRLLDGCCSIQP